MNLNFQKLQVLKSLLPTKSLYYLHSRRTNLHCQEIPPLSPCPCPELRGLRDHSPNRSLFRGEIGDFPKVQWLEPLVKWCFHSHAVSIFVVFLIKAVYANSSNKHSIQENKIKKQTKNTREAKYRKCGFFFSFSLRVIILLLLSSCWDFADQSSWEWQFSATAPPGPLKRPPPLASDTAFHWKVNYRLMFRLPEPEQTAIHTSLYL